MLGERGLNQKTPVRTAGMKDHDQGHLIRKSTEGNPDQSHDQAAGLTDIEDSLIQLLLMMSILMTASTGSSHHQPSLILRRESMFIYTFLSFVSVFDIELTQQTFV